MLVTCLISPLLTCPNQDHEVVFIVFAKNENQTISIILIEVKSQDMNRRNFISLIACGPEPSGPAILTLSFHLPRPPEFLSIPCYPTSRR